LTSPWGSLAQDTSGSPSNNKELIEEPVLRYTLPYWQRSTLCCTGRNPTAPLGLLPSEAHRKCLGSALRSLYIRGISARRVSSGSDII